MIKSIHETHGTTSYFTLPNKFKNQFEEVDEANELNNQIDEFSEAENGYIFESITKIIRILDTMI